MRESNTFECFKASLSLEFFLIFLLFFGLNFDRDVSGTLSSRWVNENLGLKPSVFHLILTNNVPLTSRSKYYILLTIICHLIRKQIKKLEETPMIYWSFEDVFHSLYVNFVIIVFLKVFRID